LTRSNAYGGLRPAIAAIAVTCNRSTRGSLMELQYSPAELAFRDEIRAFIRANLPEDIRQGMLLGGALIRDHVVTWQRILNRKGWAVSHWPVEWGGTGWSPIQQYIFTEELQRAPAPRPLAYSVYMLGPVLIAFGSDEQKRRFLPRIANLDDWWCQGFSEPDAGSDLASVKTSARREGDHYIVNGQKTWTSYAQYADWIFCLVRTDPGVKKQLGISFLLIDMKSPGVTVRPIQTIDGGHEINEVFFDNVKVPVANRVGEENKGWDYAKYLLSAERINLARVGVSKERLTRVRELAARQMHKGRPLIEDPRFREKLAAIEVELKALEITQLRVISAESHADGGKADPASSILKIKGSELQQATSELLMQALGPGAMRAGSDENECPDWTSAITGNYFNLRKVSIFGGSNEIQKSIIARTILGL
jgi:pimeloyl-CoA dehydrogenase large subunit